MGSTIMKKNIAVGIILIFLVVVNICFLFINIKNKESFKNNILDNDKIVVLAMKYGQSQEEILRIYNYFKDWEIVECELEKNKNALTNEEILDYISKGFTFDEINFANYASIRLNLPIKDIFNRINKGEAISDIGLEVRNLGSDQKTKIEKNRYYVFSEQPTKTDTCFSLKDFLPVAYGMTSTQVYNILGGRSPNKELILSSAGPHPVYEVITGGEILINYALQEDEFLVSEILYYGNPENEPSKSIELLKKGDIKIP